jgi:predicted nucleic acid-binding protein
MKAFVLDANALITYWEKREGSERVVRILDSADSGNASVMMSVINIGEAFYAVWRKNGEPEARLRLQQLVSSPIDLVPLDLAGTVKAAELKAKYRCAYADAFAASLALSKHATLVTADADLRRFSDKIRILWLPGHKSVN